MIRVEEGGGDVRRRLLSVYLNDHAALGVAGIELARRARAGNADTPFGRCVDSLIPELESHQAALERIMGALQVRRNPVKTGAAWAGEKLGRLKPNGALASKSPLSPVLEAEALLIAVSSYAALWRGLGSLPDSAVPEGVDVAALAATAEGSLAELERHRLDLLRRAVGP